jgi:hypothetical protein
MSLFKRCKCPDATRCRHPYHYHFKLHRRRHFGTTKTANRQLAERIATTRRAAALEDREGLRKPNPILLTEHVTAYVAHTAKANRSSYKDRPVLDRFLA